MPSGVTLDGLRVLCAVAARGSLTAAAEHLGYTQSAVSRQLAALESGIGVSLFERRARGVRLMPAGAVLLRHAGLILAAVDAAEREAAGLRDRVAGRVAVGAFPSAAAVLVPRAIAALRAEHPALEVTVREGLSPSLLDDVRAGRLPVAVVNVGATPPALHLEGLTVETVFAGELQVAVSVTHRFAHRLRVRPEELALETWIVDERGGGAARFEAWPTLPQPRIGYRARQWSTRLGMVAAGLGVCLVPEMAAPSVPNGVCVIGVDDPDWAGRRTVAAARPERSREVDVVVGALRAAGSALETGAS